VESNQNDQLAFYALAATVEGLNREADSFEVEKK
jgi:hypothetical protein